MRPDRVPRVLDIPTDAHGLVLQVFNFLNARKLNNEYNIFEGLHKSYIFLAILAFIVGAQVCAAPSVLYCSTSKDHF